MGTVQRFHFVKRNRTVPVVSRGPATRKVEATICFPGPIVFRFPLLPDHRRFPETGQLDRCDSGSYIRVYTYTHVQHCFVSVFHKTIYRKNSVQLSKYKENGAGEND